MGMSKISVYKHVLDSTEDNLYKTSHILSQFERRCNNMAAKATECEPEKYEDMLRLEISDFMYELSNVFHFMSSTLEVEADQLSEYIHKGTEELRNQIKLAA